MDITLGLPEIILAAITVLSPILAAIANQSKWDSKVKNAVAFGIALVIAVLYLVFTGAIADWSDIPTVVLAVYGLQQLVYKQFLTELSKRVEAVTSVKSGEKVVVSPDVPNEVQETGDEGAQVEILDDPTDEEAGGEPNYQAQHRGDVPLG